MLRLAALTCACLVFAGCLGGSTPPSKVTPAAVTPTDAGTPLAGSDAAGNSTANATPVAEKVSPVQYSGKSETGACAFAVAAGQCEFPANGNEGLHALDITGKPQRVSGSVTWTSSAPGTTFFLFACKKDGANIACHGKPASGASPLKFDFDLTAYNATDTVLLATDNELGSCAAAACAFTFPGADFKIDGTLAVAKSR